MRVLMVCHMPWRRDLGGPRAQVELTDLLRGLGHEVDTFSWEDAPEPGGLRGRAPGALLRFARAADRYLRRHPGGYDLVDAQQGTVLRVPNGASGRPRLLVRSVGLVSHYNDWERRHRVAVPPATLRQRAAWAHRRVDMAANAWAARRSYEVADRIVVPNTDERRTLGRTPRWGAKTSVVPLVLCDDAAAALVALPRTAPGPAPTAVFLGAWGPRKGSLDWGAIVAAVWRHRPDVRFRFAGTGAPDPIVRADVGVGLDEVRVEVVPSYDPADLPALLRDAAAGAFPSYVEGLGLGVLEMLAAGLPTVAYDAPGPRDLLRVAGTRLLTPPGDAGRFADAIVDVLRADDYPKLVEVARDIAGRHVWSSVLPDMLRIYAGEPA